MYKDHGITANLEVGIPLSFSASQIVIKDTVEARLDVEDVSNGSFTLLTQNSFPLDASIKMVLLDQSDMVLKELLSDQIVQACEINELGKTIASHRAN